MRLILLWGLSALALSASACGGGLPHEFPSASAASPDAVEMSPAQLTTATQGDPPLPGESGVGAWPGLAGARPSAAHHHHHGSQTGAQ
ncbi:MAG: hypothetical protein IPK60_07780 [Sandaracinaceae bacterium]|nr:hypothetical protein [Sandaracinaceae bacterium]